MLRYVNFGNIFRVRDSSPFTNRVLAADLVRRGGRSKMSLWKGVTQGDCGCDWNMLNIWLISHLIYIPTVSFISSTWRHHIMEIVYVLMAYYEGTLLHIGFVMQNFSAVLLAWVLTHWGRVTHICVSKLSILGSDNGLSPGRRQAII